MSAPSLLLTDQLELCDRIREWAAANAPGVLGEALLRHVDALEACAREGEVAVDSFAQFLLEAGEERA